MPKLSDYLDGVAAKCLTAVEVDPARSNQHEFQGVQLLKNLLGPVSEPVRFEANFFSFENEELSDPVQTFVTWSDVRRSNPARSAEYHLYYSHEAESIVHMANPGDLLFVARLKNIEDIYFFIVPSGSSFENSFLWLFGLDHPGTGRPGVTIFKGVDDKNIGYLESQILEMMGIETESDNAAQYDNLLRDRFGLKLPLTSIFSEFAREIASVGNMPDEPDATLIAWFSTEQMLFKRMEKMIVEERLRQGFVEDEEVDVEGFISFSLSVQNRRKSRAGHAFEHHLAAIFREHNLIFDGQATTEGKKKPDFLFPGRLQYHDTNFPTEELTLLAAKSTCKDRWRQVLSEAERIPDKHLVTLEPGISPDQTDEMKASHLVLVVPLEIQSTYKDKQLPEILSLKNFIEIVSRKQEIWK